MEIIPTLLLYIQHILLVVLLFAVFYMSGRVLTQLFFSQSVENNDKPHLTVTDIIFTCFLGFVLFIKFAFIIALFDVFYLPMFVLLALIMCGCFALNAAKGNIRLPLLNYGHGLTILLLLFLALNSMGPLVGADDISYHLPYARAFVENHGLVVQPHLIYPFQTLEVNVFYAFGLMIGDETFVRLLNISFLALLIILLYDFVKEKTNAWVALIITVIIYGSTKIQLLSVVIYVDFAYALFASIAFIAFIKWKEAKTEKEALYYLVLAALGVAEAASTKYFGLACGLIIFIFFMFHSKQKIRDAIVFLGVCVCLGTWWYVRNMIFSGNPVHPFLSDIFGFYIWNQADLNLNLAELSSYGGAESFNHYFKQLKKVTDSLSYYFYASVLVALFYRVKYPHNALAKVNLNLVLITILFSIFWYFSAHIERYLLPALGTACASIVISIYLILSSFNIANKVYTRLIILLISSYFVAFGIYRDVEHLVYYPVQKHDSLLTHQVSGYRLLTKANELQFPNRRIYQVGFADKAYHYDGVAAGHWMGGARWSDVADTSGWRLLMKPANEVADYLRQNNYSAIVLSNVATFDKEELLLAFDIVFEDDFGLIAVPKDL